MKRQLQSEAPWHVDANARGARLNCHHPDATGVAHPNADCGANTCRRSRSVAPAPMLHVVIAARQQALEENEKALRTILMALPTFTFTGRPADGISVDILECSLCLEAYSSGDILRAVRGLCPNARALVGSIPHPHSVSRSLLSCTLLCATIRDPCFHHYLVCRSCRVATHSIRSASTAGCSVRSRNFGIARARCVKLTPFAFHSELLSRQLELRS